MPQSDGAGIQHQTNLSEDNWIKALGQFMKKGMSQEEISKQRAAWFSPAHEGSVQHAVDAQHDKHIAPHGDGGDGSTVGLMKKHQKDLEEIK